MTPDAMSKDKSQDADVESTPTAVLQAIEAQQVMRKGSEARLKPRQFLCMAAALQIREGPGSPVKHAQVATNNISEGGFGFIFDSHLRPGTMIRVCFESLPGRPCIKGVVRSSVRICGTQYRVGVEFTTS